MSGALNALKRNARGPSSQNQSEDTVMLYVSHSNLKSRFAQLRFDLHATIGNVKKKLRSHAGSAAESVLLQLYDGGGSKLCDLAEDHRPLRFFSPLDGYRIHIVDLDPTSLSAGGWLQDTSLVEKHQISDELYNKRDYTFRKSKEKPLAEDPTWKLHKANALTWKDLSEVQIIQILQTQTTSEGRRKLQQALQLEDKDKVDELKAEILLDLHFSTFLYQTSIPSEFKTISMGHFLLLASDMENLKDFRSGMVGIQDCKVNSKTWKWSTRRLGHVTSERRRADIFVHAETDPKFWISLLITRRFAREQRFSIEKISALVSIVKDIHQQSTEGRFTVAKSWEYAKNLLLMHTVQRPPFSTALFSLVELQTITQYLLHTYYKHYKLYAYAFTPTYILNVETMKVDLHELAPVVPILRSAETEDEREAHMARLQKELEEIDRKLKESEQLAREAAIAASIEAAYRATIPTEVTQAASDAVVKHLEQMRTDIEEKLLLTETMILGKLKGLPTSRDSLTDKTRKEASPGRGKEGKEKVKEGKKEGKEGKKSNSKK